MRRMGPLGSSSWEKVVVASYSVRGMWRVGSIIVHNPDGWEGGLGELGKGLEALTLGSGGDGCAELGGRVDAMVLSTLTFVPLLC